MLSDALGINNVISPAQLRFLASLLTFPFAVHLL
jgi:hypothetical protein